VPVLRVRIGLVGYTLGLGPLVPAILDTGATWTLFPEDMGRELGLHVRSGRREETNCSNGEVMEIFLHRVRVAFPGGHVDLEAGFGEKVFFPVIGRVGFLERFRVTFDHTFTPPGFEITPLPLLPSHQVVTAMPRRIT